MKLIALGSYSDKGLAGFVQNPNDDRRAAASKMIEAAGGKLLDMHLLRGKYDFCAIIEIGSFEAAAGMKVVMMASGAVKEMETLEAIDMSKVASHAAKIAGTYKPPGK